VILAQLDLEVYQVLVVTKEIKVNNVTGWPQKRVVYFNAKLQDQWASLVITARTALLDFLVCVATKVEYILN
jgi:hypothetical protein